MEASTDGRKFVTKSNFPRNLTKPAVFPEWDQEGTHAGYEAMISNERRSAFKGSFSRLRGAVGKPLVRNTVWQYVSNIAGAVIVFVYSLVVGRMLGVEQYGLLSLCLGFAGLVFNFIELRLHESVIRYLTEFWEAGDLPRALATVRLSLMVDVVTGLLALLLVGALAPFAPLFFADLHGEGHTTLFCLAGLALFFSNVGNATAIGLLRVFDQFRALALVKLAGQIFKVLMTVAALIVLKWNVTGVLAIAVATNLFSTLGLAIVAYRQLNQRIPLRTTSASIELLRPRLKEMRGFALNMYGVSLAAIPTRDLDINLLGAYSSAGVIGTYKVARDFMAAIWQISDPLLFVLYPEFAKLWTRREFQSLSRYLTWGVVGLCISSVCLCGTAYFIVPPIIEISLGAQFAPAGTFFQWMLCGALAWIPLLWVNPLLMAAGRANLFLRASLVASIVILLIDVALIPHFEGTGAAIAYAVGHVAAPLVSLWLAKSAGIFKQLRAEPEPLEQMATTE